MSASLKCLGLAFVLSLVCKDTFLNSTFFVVVPNVWILKGKNTNGRDIYIFWRTTNRTKPWSRLQLSGRLVVLSCRRPTVTTFPRIHTLAYQATSFTSMPILQITQKYPTQVNENSGNICHPWFSYSVSSAGTYKLSYLSVQQVF